MTLNATTRTGHGARSAGIAARLAMRTRGGIGGVALALALVSPLAAQQEVTVTGRPVLLELYTSQGCASCPPADDLMLELAARDDVIALALHVDYWDYIGWPDTLASHAHTERQQAYARRHGHSTIYTPQVVVNGIELIEGFRTMQVMDSIAAQHALPPEVSLTLIRTGNGGLEIQAAPLSETAPALALTSRRSAVGGVSANAVIGSFSMSRPAEAPAVEPTVPAATEVATLEAADDASLTASSVMPDAAAVSVPVPVLTPVVATGPFVLQLVRYRDTEIVEILGGENAGRTATYANVVTDWQPIANWDMAGPLTLTVPLAGDEPVVVLVQEVGQGEIIAAARLR